MSIIANNLLQGDEGYNISRSLRLRGSATGYLNRTPASAGNRRTWTLSGWIKRGSTSSQLWLFSAGSSGTAGNAQYFLFDSDKFGFTNFGVGASQTTAIFRDYSAWYHVVLAIDTTQATESNRIKIFVNGVSQTVSTGACPTQNTDFFFNNTQIHTIGCASWNLGGNFDGYLTEINFIDGQALTPSSFGETNPITGVWQPKKYGGTYGTNGFFLPFSNNASTTTLGNDFSGNSNNWTTNNISLTAGSTYDSMTDVPTLTSAAAANFAVLNPLSKTGQTVSNGNLTFSSSTGTSSQCAAPTFAVGSSGKWYWEVQITSTPQNQTEECIGIVNDIGTPSSLQRAYNSAGQYFDGSSWTSYGSAWSVNDIIGIAIDVDNSQITFYKNNVSQGTKTWAWNSNGNCSLRLGSSTGTTYQANFGQRPFSYTPPTGFVALNTFNLPEPSIKAGNKYMDALTWTGDGTSPKARTGYNFSPDFVWTKGRSGATDHALFDRVRGTGAKVLESNMTDAENNYGLTVDSFDANGFTTSTGSFNHSYANSNGATYVGWAWKANGTGVTNTAGSITSTVSANPTAGFSVVTYTGTGASATVGHGLGVAPSMVIYKRRNATDSWIVYFSSIGAANSLTLNNTNAQSAGGGTYYWNGTAPTSSVFSVATDSALNASGSTYVAYCFAEVAGYSKFGSYTGNGSADGPFVHLGFRPKFVMIKNATTGSTNWFTYDSSRNLYNLTNAVLLPNGSNAELTSDGGGAFGFDFLSNGFKVRTTRGDNNNNGDTFIYATFAENPFKNSLAR